MNDRRLDDLIRATNPVPDTSIDALVRSVDIDELSEEIMSTSTITPPIPRANEAIETVRPTPAGRRPGRAEHRRRPSRLLALAAAAVVVLTVGIVLTVRDDGGQAWAAELIEFAERSPLLLLDGADVTYADQYGSEGEMQFDAEGAEASLHWRDGDLDEWLDDRRQSGDDVGRHAVPGGVATIVRYDYTDDYTALWELDGRVLEFRSEAVGLSAFRSMLGELERADVDDWLSAMPESVIELASQEVVIEEMLVGLPLPPGFDRDALAGEAPIMDRYQLGARVVGAVSCAWIERWATALDSGDTATADEAVTALQSSPNWPVIQEMNRSGAYGQVLESYVDAMAAGGELAPGGATVQDTHRDALGC